jgi:plasmid maintenance system antidote protein VapI
MTLLEKMMYQRAQTQGVTLKAVARSMGLRAETIGNAMRGRYPMSQPTLFKLAAWLELEPDAVRAAALQQVAEIAQQQKVARKRIPPAMLDQPVITFSGTKVRATINVRWSCERCPWVEPCGVEVQSGWYAWCEDVLEGEVIPEKVLTVDGRR